MATPDRHQDPHHPDLGDGAPAGTGTGVGEGVSADLDAQELIALAGASLRRRRLDEVEELQVLAAWADLHSADGPGGLVTPGGEGTPGVRDHCLGEIALARSAGVVSTVNAIADVLDLRHRMPLTWARTRAGVVDVWLVRKIARMSRHLPLARMWVLDQAIARLLGHEAPPRVLAAAEGKIIEADPDLHQRRVDEEARQRYVRLHSADEHGLRTLIARLDAGDATWVEATVTRVAEILAPRHPDHTTQELRAKAMGYLARPAELLALLAANTTPDGHLDVDLPDDPWADDRSDRSPAAADAPVATHRAVAFPADLLARLAAVDWKVLRPRHTLYVHLHQDVINGTVTGAARVEGLSAMSLDQIHGLLAGAHVSVKPVLDLHQRIRTSAYEHPESVKERSHLIHGGDYWPHASSTSRRLDHDHVIPYVKGGPTGQTGTHNAAPIARRHHRYRTHAGYQVHPSADFDNQPGSYLWTTPGGQAFLTDHQGTRRLPSGVARLLINAPPCPPLPDYDICGPPSLSPDVEPDEGPDPRSHAA